MKQFSIYIFLLLGFQSIGQEEMTLPKAISIALENNYQIKIADQFIQIAENNNTWARAGKTPTIDLTGSFSNTLTRDNNPASFLQGSFYNGSLGGTVTAGYVLYAGGRIRVAKDQLDIAINREQLNKQTGIHDLMRNIYQTYYDVILQNERLSVLESVFQLSKDRLSYENTKKEYGTSNAFNIVQFENALLQDSLNLINQQQIIDIAERTLYNTISLTGRPAFTFQEKLSVTPEEINNEALKNALSEENYTLKSLSLLASVNLLNTELAKAAKKPTVSLSASVGGSQNGFKFYADDPNTGDPFPFIFSNRFNGNIGASMNWNLYDGNVRNTDIQNAKLQEEIDLLSLAEAKLALTNQVDILIDNYNNQKNILTLTDSQINLSSQNLDIAEERFKSGQITSLDYRNIQTQYLNAAFNKVNAIFNLIITKSEIDYLVGRYE